ncbi:ribonuclease III [Leptolyngbya sp. CCNP1308]|uniref:ribonuclease III n=1 Tax=Leptolyngbya sp. CCNP1308 TaxID=3110255 RepID=UPI002B20CD58|nr:ribonuclease III [Leptolyngbya sp. CCNP1308]MEA5451476.1 ribonuclease III [Leptolyngbya sp. CCNP1308]
MTDLPPFRQRQLEQWVQNSSLPAAVAINWVRLDQALTHRSVDATHNYEQLELLGDAVLRLAATECLQEHFPEASVGELSAVRSVLISDRTLAQLAQALDLAPYLTVAPGMTVGPTHLADALEAVVAVLYLETHTLGMVRAWLDDALLRLAAIVRQDPARQNYKVALQELTQAHSKTLPQYRTVEQQPVDGDPQRYASTVWFRETCWGSGHGSTKKQAEQAAAAAAYDRLCQTLTHESSAPSH